MSKEQNKSGHLIDEATKTPRTQAAIKTYGDYIRREDAVPIEFAEQLETELAEARADIERKDKLIEQMREIFQNIVDYPGHPDFTKNEIHSMQMLAIEGICAAEGGE